MNASDTPLLLIAWRRPHTLRQVIDAIRPVAPTRLYVACDGPNPDRPGEAEKVAATRAVIETEIDWPCQIERLYADVNQGCRLGVSRAISWFFEQVEEGIILEEDCVPHPDFFPYCTTLLERYRHDTRVWSINGSQFLSPRQCSRFSKRSASDYWASAHADSWGWATWRRCWALVDGTYGRWVPFRDSSAFASTCSGRDEQAYWGDIIQGLITLGKPSSWFYGWLLAGWQQGALSLWPYRNLVSHIGSDPAATHCQGRSPYLHRPLQPLPPGPLRHPARLCRDRQADRALYLGRRGGWQRLWQQCLGALHPWWIRCQRLSSHLQSSVHDRLRPDMARKVRWRLRHERHPWMVTCADKWAVKAWAAEHGVATAATIAVASHVDDLPWQQLPARCLLKASHGWSWNLLRWDGHWYRFGDGVQFVSEAETAAADRDCGGLQPERAPHCRLSEAEVREIASTWLESVYSAREWAYTQIPPRLLVEEILQPARPGPLFDHRFFAMHGRVRAIGVGSPLYRRSAALVLMDTHWRPLPVRSTLYEWPLQLPPRPLGLAAMLQAVQRLGADIPFARFDFYDTIAGPVLGEVTVTPYGGISNPTDDPAFNRWLAAPWYLGPLARLQALWV